MSEYNDRNIVISGYKVVVEQESAHNFGAYSLELPGCVAAGNTLDEVVHNMSEVIPLYIEGLIEDDLPVPPPVEPAISPKSLVHH